MLCGAYLFQIAICLALNAVLAQTNNTTGGGMLPGFVQGNVGDGCGYPLVEMRCEVNMLAWLRAGGGTAHGVAPAIFPGRGRGLAATTTLSAGSLPLRIPRALQMSYSTGCSTPFAVALELCEPVGGSTNSSAKDPVHSEKEAVVALWLLHERYAAPSRSSPWWPYIAALPKSYPAIEFETAGMPSEFFTEVSALQLAALDGMVVQPHLMHHLEEINRLVSHMKHIVATASQHSTKRSWLHCGASSCSPSAPTIGRGSRGMPTVGQRWAETDYRWAAQTVKTRAWDDETVVRGREPHPGPALVPAADLVNHDSLSTTRDDEIGRALLLGQQSNGDRLLKVGSSGLLMGAELLDLYLPLPRHDAKHDTKHGTEHRGSSSEGDVVGRATLPQGFAVPAVHHSSIAHLAGSFGIFDPSYPLPLSLLPISPATENADGNTRIPLSLADEMLSTFGCMQVGLLPLGTGDLAQIFAARLLGCLRLECAAKIRDPAVITSMTIEEASTGTSRPRLFLTDAVAHVLGQIGGVGAVSPGWPWPWPRHSNVHDENGLLAAVEKIERCATIKALEHIGAELGHYASTPARLDSSPRSSAWIGIRTVEGERAVRRDLLEALKRWEGDAYRAVYEALKAMAGVQS